LLIRQCSIYLQQETITFVNYEQGTIRIAKCFKCIYSLHYPRDIRIYCSIQCCRYQIGKHNINLLLCKILLSKGYDRSILDYDIKVLLA